MLISPFSEPMTSSSMPGGTALSRSSMSGELSPFSPDARVPVASPPNLGPVRNIITLEDLVRYLKRYWKWALGVSIVLSLAMLVLLTGRTPMFRSESFIEVRMESVNVVPNPVMSGSIPENSAMYAVNNHRVGLETRKYRDYFYEQLGEEERIAFLEDAGVEKTAVSSAVAWIKENLKAALKTATSLLGGGDHEAAGDFKEAFMRKLDLSVEVDTVKDTHLLRIAVKSPNRETAATIANEYARHYTDYTTAVDVQAKRNAFQFLRDQAAELGKRVKESEQMLLQYQLENDALIMEDEKGSVMDKLRLIQKAIADLRLKQSELDQALEMVKAARDEGRDLLTVQMIAQHPGISELRQRISQASQEKAAMEATHGPHHYRVKETTQALQALQDQLLEEVQRAVDELKVSKAGYEDQLARLEKHLQEVKKELLAGGYDNMDLNLLQAKLNSDRQLYETVVQRMNDAAVDSQFQGREQLRVLDKAVPAEEPYRPNKPVSVVLSGFVFLGLFLGLPLSLGLAEDFGRRFGIRIPPLNREASETIGHVPHISASSKIQMLAESFSYGPARDAIFKVAYDLENKSPERDGRVVLVTSAGRGEGKTFLSSTIGGVYCAEGKRVLIIDCNLRNPALREWFPHISGQSNLVEWLESDGDHTFEPETLRHGSSELHVLPAYSSLEGPLTLLGKPCFAQLIRYATVEFDCVILDAPAVHDCPETQLLARHATEILMVNDPSISGARRVSSARSKLGQKVTAVARNDAR